MQAPSSHERRHLLESTFASRGIRCDAVQMQVPPPPLLLNL